MDLGHGLDGPGGQATRREGKVPGRRDEGPGGVEGASQLEEMWMPHLGSPGTCLGSCPGLPSLITESLEPPGCLFLGRGTRGSTLSWRAQIGAANPLLELMAFQK